MLNNGLVLKARYEIVAPLNTGGMGMVFDAYDLSLKRPVAVKVVRPELAISYEWIDKFIQEAQTSGQLRHPHILSIHDLDYLEIGGEKLPYLVMDLALGG